MLHSVDWRYGPDSAVDWRDIFHCKAKRIRSSEEPEGDDELADDSGPSDHGEDEYSNVPAMPAQKVDPASKAPKFGPVSKPGIFLGYRLEPGGQWKGDYYVADLEFSRCSVHQVKRIWRNSGEGYVFPMLAAYERLTREVQLLNTGQGKGLPKADAPAEPDNQLGADDPDPGQPSDDNNGLNADPEAPADVPERDHWVRDEESKSTSY